MDWEKFYAHYPLTVDPDDHLKQVGHTVSGKSIDDRQFQRLLAHIRDLLDLQESDVLLDLCCGNGVITRQLARQCAEVVGIDFSEPLLDVANSHYRSPNIQYQLMDALALGNHPTALAGQYNKILMFGALQHFGTADLEPMLRAISGEAREGFVIVLGFVPDRARKWALHDTASRKMKYVLRRVTGRDRMGTWWDRRFVEKICRNLGYECTFHPIDEDFNRGGYRMSIRIS